MNAIRMVWPAIAFLVVGCGPTVDDHIEALGRGGEARDRATQELLLAPKRSVTPLLAAIEREDLAASHAAIADILVSLTLRIDEPRLSDALHRHLASHPSAQVRAAICHRAGLAKRAELIGGMVQALQDPAAEVRFEALRSLAMLETRLSDDQRATIEAAAFRMADDPHDALRSEAILHIEATVDRLLKEADRFVTEARLDSAEAAFLQVAQRAPVSWKARYRLARFYLDNGQQETGLRQLREMGAILDVRRVDSAPTIDGRLDEPLWARLDSTALPFKVYTGHGSPADIPTRARLAYDAEALYMGFHCYDAAPDSLVSRMTGRDDGVWNEESLEIFFDGNLDRRSYAQIVTNALGTVFDATTDERGLRDPGYTADVEVATHTGEDVWSVEMAIRFDTKWLPAAQPGDRWGANLARNFRDRSHSSQWVYTYGSFHRVNDFGLLLFE